MTFRLELQHYGRSPKVFKTDIRPYDFKSTMPFYRGGVKRKYGLKRRTYRHGGGYKGAVSLARRRYMARKPARYNVGVTGRFSGSTHEKKYFDGTYNQAADFTAEALTINAIDGGMLQIAQGTGPSNRIGS